MASVNRVILIGNLGRDPEVRYAPSGDAIANLAIATSEQWKDKNGEKQERTEWHRVVLFGKQADVAGEYLKKGSSVYIEGRLQTRKWTDQSGQERYTTEVVADRMQMLGGRSNAGSADADMDQTERYERPQRAERPAGRAASGNNAARPQAKPQPAADFNDFSDDIPF